MLTRLPENEEHTPAAAGESPVPLEISAEPSDNPSSARTFTRNSFASVGRLLVATIVALVLPAYLTHRLPVKTYSAWILVLQMSAYVGYLDFGVQTGISKYVAEYVARKDAAGASMRASAGLALMLMTSFAGVVLTLVLAWRVPQIFNEMPSALFRDVRVSLVLVGLSLCFGLLCSICSAIFLGLQRFTVPMALSLANRILFTVAVFVAVFLHSSLAVMGACVAVVNVVTGLAQVVAWRRMAGQVKLSLRHLDMAVVRKMLTYCSSLAVWTAGMLCVSGLDVTIVGRYDFAHTAFYAVATLPTNFMLSIMGAAVGPLMPTASAMSVTRNSEQMGQMLTRATRYASTLLVLAGLPLLVAGVPILRLWVGTAYATQTILYLRILVLANVVRNLCLPYSSMLIAVESQKVAIVGASAEALVNLSASLYLVRHMGAVGVAYGTLIGSFVSVGMHFALSMRYTYNQLLVTRTRLFVSGMVRPALVGIPTLLLAPFWWRNTLPAMGAGLWAGWFASTLLLAWYVALEPGERARLLRLATPNA